MSFFCDENIFCAFAKTTAVFPCYTWYTDDADDYSTGIAIIVTSSRPLYLYNGNPLPDTHSPFTNMD